MKAQNDRDIFADNDNSDSAASDMGNVRKLSEI